MRKIQMNERFKKIADEANAYTDVSGRWVNSAGMQKFAELIVKECIGILEKEIVLEMDRMLTSANETDETLHANKVRHFTSLAAKSYAHFGVEE
jgi:hypothetical protein